MAAEGIRILAETGAQAQLTRRSETGALLCADGGIGAVAARALAATEAARARLALPLLQRAREQRARGGGRARPHAGARRRARVDAARGRAGSGSGAGRVTLRLSRLWQCDPLYPNGCHPKRSEGPVVATNQGVA